MPGQHVECRHTMVLKGEIFMSHLVGDVWAGVADISIHLSHDANMLVAVEEGVLLLALNTHAAGPTVGSLVRLEAGMRENDNQPLGVLVGGCDGKMLLGYKLG